MFTNIILAMLIQNAVLVHTDIYDNTKYGMQTYGWIENNPIANVFWKNNQWDLGFSVAFGAQFFGNILALNWDNSGILCYIVNATISGLEAWAITSTSYYSDVKPDQLANIHFKALIFAYEF